MDGSDKPGAGEEHTDEAADSRPATAARARAIGRRALAHRAVPPAIVLAVFMLIGLFALHFSPAGGNGPGATDNAAGSTDSPGAAAPGEAASPLSRFGVLAPAAATQAAPVIKELGGGWVRINYTVRNGNGPDLQPYLDAGLNIILTLNYADPDNLDSTYGTNHQWPQAGFPYKSRILYQEQLHSVLSAYDAPLRSGRIWLQCENEIADAAQVPDSTFWRGTDDQYLKQLQTFYETVKSIDSDIPVVLAGVQSTAMDTASDQKVINHLDKLLQSGNYDVADLHFYGCTGEIPVKIGWMKSHMRSGKSWISTENGGPDSRCEETPGRWDANPQQFEQIQAQLVGQRLKACADGGGTVCLWFSLLDMPNESPVFSHLGLIDATGAQPRRKPAFDAFRNFVAAYGKAANAPPA